MWTRRKLFGSSVSVLGFESRSYGLEPFDTLLLVFPRHPPRYIGPPLVFVHRSRIVLQPLLQQFVHFFGPIGGTLRRSRRCLAGRFLGPRGAPYVRLVVSRDALLLLQRLIEAEGRVDVAGNGLPAVSSSGRELPHGLGQGGELLFFPFPFLGHCLGGLLGLIGLSGCFSFLFLFCYGVGPSLPRILCCCPHGHQILLFGRHVSGHLLQV
mmetsp:Transcript_13592/g.29994  ORF Transcript_13592/g.29994 Transcript_13592/m.29994 type:complete len:210 (+) Transcript_13592:94-723(+)